uniref:Uncharacterized protein n=1 Tax=Magallana gigas TaxID=29159 RepID=K1QQ76_MAGGI
MNEIAQLNKNRVTPRFGDLVPPHFIDGEPSEKLPDPVSALPHNITTSSRPAPKRRHALEDISQKESEKKQECFDVTATEAFLRSSNGV